MDYQKDIRYCKRFRIKRYLLNMLFPVRILICIALLLLTYQHFKEIGEKKIRPTSGNKNDGNLLSITLFGLVIFLMNCVGWWGVIKRNWSLACAFNATSILLILIDVYCTLFDLHFHLIALVVTVLIFIINILLAIDLDILRKQQEMIRRARIEEAERRRKPPQLLTEQYQQQSPMMFDQPPKPRYENQFQSPPSQPPQQSQFKAIDLE
ncbi:hypothetical protein QR98_0090530 [Sarcoptes scabiei]|uniref:Uncharacterized protein n=1 Tax=Sarcoptes scabiei TaxID=52283 RepID=A0A132AHU4_SARSC|nr:hypothetical protein QR98_0090530 [Sarcoptes scabiei]